MSGCVADQHCQLLAIEGGDGAGKATTAAAVVDLLTARGKRARVMSFPRYRDTVGGHVLGDFLAGRLPHALAPRAVAVLYALDRFESRDAIAEAMAASDVLVFDRYIASNVAYQCAKVDDADAPALADWIVGLETHQFALPRPALSIYLDTDIDRARQLIAQKAKRSYTDATYDEHEADQELQRRVRARYAMLCDGGVLGRWARVPTVAGGAMRPPAEIAAEIVDALEATA
jgi:dTMP kinase